MSTQLAIREEYADVGDQRLHYVEAGDGPLIVLLHGFPEFWYGWRLQIEPLAAAGFRVVAPDTRGYNLSSKPDGVAAYDTGQLAADIRGLVQERGAETALLVGHDWGGTIAWATAMHHPEGRCCVERNPGKLRQARRLTTRCRGSDRGHELGEREHDAIQCAGIGGQFVVTAARVLDERMPGREDAQ